ncbi:MAG: ethanolamine utilization protein EutH [Clostridia bacterium]|nr:ethanolamine utilization protein EutH [Clostridia bacterium]
MHHVILFLMACGALIGGVDRMLGNRLGLGDKFEEGFRLLGSVALCQAGMICVAPLLSALLGPVITPVFRFFRVDPAMAGAILAIDMGGYQMAEQLAADALIGRFSGIVAASMLGCTLTYTIPVGTGLIPEGLQSAFARGTMCGLIALPFALIPAGLACGIPWMVLLLCCLPVLILSFLLAFLLLRFPVRAIRFFRIFARAVRGITTLGLALGAFQSLSGLTLLRVLAPLEEAMAVVSSIGIALLGSLPLAELLRRALHRPMQRLGDRIGVGERGMTGMLIAAINITPALVSLREMDERSATLTAAFAVSGASALTAHLGFAASLAPEMVGPMLLGKFAGAFLAAALAWGMTRRYQTN